VPRLLLLASVCLGCATAPAAPSVATRRPGVGSTPEETLAHAIALLERRDHRRFLEELFKPSDVAAMKASGEDVRAIQSLEDEQGRKAAADLRRALASAPRVRQDGALEYRPGDGTSVILSRQDGLWYLADTEPERAPDPAPPELVLLYVKIPRAIDPITRGSRYEESIDEVMRAHQVGSVTGGGSMVSQSGRIQFVGIDVHVTDVNKALPLLRAQLRKLRVPKGTVIEQTVGIGPFRRSDVSTITHEVW
jgi:hypothetical protein